MPGAALPSLRADRRAVLQMLLNLLSNAIKFTPTGGRITISAAHNPDGTLALSVTDTGIGIAPENIAKVLEPFGQVADAYTRGHAGTGLGLPLTKSLVEAHGGSLGIESTLGKGATVTVRFPAGRVIGLGVAAVGA
jgi:signal transduction histidine kinase